MISSVSSTDVRSLTFEKTDDGLLIEARFVVRTPGCDDKIACCRWLVGDIAYLAASIEHVVSRASDYEISPFATICEPPKIKSSRLELTFGAKLNFQDGKYLSEFWFEDDTPGPGSA